MAAAAARRRGSPLVSAGPGPKRAARTASGPGRTNFKFLVRVDMGQAGTRESQARRPSVIWNLIYVHLEGWVMLYNIHVRLRTTFVT